MLLAPVSTCDGPPSFSRPERPRLLRRSDLSPLRVFKKKTYLSCFFLLPVFAKKVMFLYNAFISHTKIVSII